MSVCLCVHFGLCASCTYLGEAKRFSDLKLLVRLKCLSLALQSSQHSAALLLGSWKKWRISFVEQRTADKVVAAANRRRTQQVCVVSVLFWSVTRMLLVEHT